MVLGKNDVFGDSISDALNRPRDLFCKSACCVRSLSYTDLNKISLSDLLQILDLYPEFAVKFLAKFNITFNLKSPVSANGISLQSCTDLNPIQHVLLLLHF